MLAGIRGTFTLTERVAPGISGRLGEHFFFRINPPPSLAHRNRPGTPAGEPFTASLDGHLIRGFQWGDEGGPTVILMHGWSGWWQHLQVYVNPLVAAGFRVLAFDALGHGSSDVSRFGRRMGCVPEIADSLGAVADQIAQPTGGIIAHSGGAMAAAVAVHRLGVVTPRLGLIAPSLTTDDVLGFMRNMFWMGPRTVSDMSERAIARIGQDLDRFDVPLLAREMAAEGRLPEALFVHDLRDRETPPERTRQVQALWPSSRLVTTSGLGHRGVLWHPGTVRQMVDYLGRSDRPDAD